LRFPVYVDRSRKFVVVFQTTKFWVPFMELDTKLCTLLFMIERRSDLSLAAQAQRTLAM
jgi:hypothetical protein